MIISSFCDSCKMNSSREPHSRYVACAGKVLDIAGIGILWLGNENSNQKDRM